MSNSVDSTRRFLAEANVAGYATDSVETTTRPDGVKIIQYKRGDYEYADVYKGFEFFQGISEVKKDGRRIMRVTYHGGIEESSPVAAEEIYSFLKECLAKATPELPFRGPRKYSQGNWEYFHHPEEGSSGDFQGMEEISYKGQRVYGLAYMGTFNPL